jgi:hypothetical protein
MNIPVVRLAALIVAAAALAPRPTLAADVSNPPQTLALVETNAYFGDVFGSRQQGDTFNARFTFSVPGPAPMNLDAIVSSISRGAAVGINITGLGLYNSGDTLIASGIARQSGATDLWTLASNLLAEGSYTIQVSGTMVSGSSGSFGGALMLAPGSGTAASAMLLATTGSTASAMLLATTGSTASAMLLATTGPTASAMSPAASRRRLASAAPTTPARTRPRAPRQTALARFYGAPFLSPARLPKISSICSKRTGLTM